MSVCRESSKQKEKVEKKFHFENQKKMFHFENKRNKSDLNQ